MLRMDPAALRKTLEQLEQAVHDHARWHDNLIRSIVCHLPCDPNDLDEKAHRQCRFGQWYYEQAPVELWEQPAFAAIEAEHKRLHQVAARMLREATAGMPVSRKTMTTSSPAVSACTSNWIRCGTRSQDRCGTAMR